MRHQVGVDRIMWGSDFPHLEGCWPFSRTHLRLAFAGVPEDEVRAMVGANAARVYGFDLDALAPLAAEFGPSPGRGRRAARTRRTSPTRRCAARPSPPPDSSPARLMQDFAGRVAVVTGGAGGIGQALGERFAAEGMKVVLADVVPGAARARRWPSCGPTGHDVTGVVTDVTDFASVEHLARRGLRHLRRRPRAVQQRRASGPAPRGRSGTTRSTTGAGAWR